MSTAAEVSRQLRAKERLRWRLFGGVVVLLFAGLMLARPAMRWWKDHRARNHLEQGQTALQNQDWPAAEMHLTEAARRLPSDPTLLRAVAAFLKGAGGDPNEQLRVLQRLKDAGQATPEDLVSLAEVQLIRGDIPAVQAILVELPPEMRSSARTLSVESELLLRLDRTPEAMDALRKLSASKPDDKDVAFRMAVLRLRHGTPSEQDDARDFLWHEATSETPRSPACIRLLLEHEELNIFQVEELARRAGAMKSDAKVPLAYLAARRQRELRPLERHTMLDDLAQKASSQPQSEQLLWLQFLASVREPQRLLGWIEQNGASLREQKPAETINLELEALAQSDQWPAVRERLTSGAARKLDPVTTELWQACTASMLDGSTMAVTDHLHAALRATHKASNQVMALKVAETADRLAIPRVSAEAYELVAAAAAVPGDRLAFLESAYEARGRLGETKEVAALARKIADLTPGHGRNEFRAMYLELLKGDALEPMVARLGSSEPDNSNQARVQQQRLLWCMVYERRKQTDVLKKEIAALDTTLPWPAGARATIAGMLADTGMADKAKALAREIPRVLLLPEELTRLDRLK